MITSEGFARRLGQAMMLRGLTAAEVAREAGFEPASVSRWLHGRGGRPRYNTLHKLEEVLRLPPGAFALPDAEWEQVVRQPGSAHELRRLMARLEVIERSLARLEERQLETERRIAELQLEVEAQRDEQPMPRVARPGT